MVQNLTYKEVSSGRFLTADQVVEQRKGIYEDKDTGAAVSLTWEKMSKSKHNGVDPESIVSEFGADTVRLFMLFKAPAESALEWDIRGIQGVGRWLTRLWKLVDSWLYRNEAGTANESSSSNNNNNDNNNNDDDSSSVADELQMLSEVHTTIERVSRALRVESHHFNVVIADLMKLSNTLADCRVELKTTIAYELSLRSLILLLAPMAPHVCSDLWMAMLSQKPTAAANALKWAGDVTQNDVLKQPWPSADKSLILENEEQLVVIQVREKQKENNNNKLLHRRGKSLWFITPSLLLSSPGQWQET
jgi:leucyl-tRNA synthetase